MMLSGGVEGGYLEKQQAGHKRNEEDETCHQVGQGKWISPEVLDVFEHATEQTTLDGASEETAEGWPENAANGPNQRHYGESSRLKLLLRHQFRHHCSDNADCEPVSLGSATNNL
jgi:hypothetical protein